MGLGSDFKPKTQGKKIYYYANGYSKIGGFSISTKKFNGKLDGKSVKVIVIDKGYRKQWFAKPKESDIETPHFVQRVDETLEVHQDSADGKSFRVMNVDSVVSGSFQSGNTFAANSGMDMLVLPMNEGANGFAIDTSQNGALITYPTDEKEWCLIGVGTFGTWQPKKLPHAREG